MMNIYPWILLAFWIVFYLYWLISALSAKENVRSNRSHAVVRALVVILALVLVFGIPGLRQIANTNIGNPVVSIVGLIITALGIGLAIWARIHLGRNWGMPMSLKKDPELVTTGPYAFIRHPIYTGILLGLVGSALVSGIIWLIIFLFFAIYFDFSARTEERLMLGQFPNQYPEYMKRTKRLIPFIY